MESLPPAMPKIVADDIGTVLAKTFNLTDLEKDLQRELFEKGQSTLWEDNRSALQSSQRNDANREIITKILADPTILNKEEEIFTQFRRKADPNSIDPLLEGYITRLAAEEDNSATLSIESLKNKIGQYEATMKNTKQEMMQYIHHNATAGFAPGSVPEIIGMMAQSLAPFIDRSLALAELGLTEELGTQKGIEQYLIEKGMGVNLDTAKSIAIPEFVKQGIRRKALSLPPEERGEYIKKIVDVVFTGLSAEINTSDFSKTALLYDIFQPEFFETGQVEGYWEDTLDNAIQVLDTVYVGWIVKWLKGVRSINQGSKFSEQFKTTKRLKSDKAPTDIEGEWTVVTDPPRGGAGPSTRGPKVDSTPEILTHIVAPQKRKVNEAKQIVSRGEEEIPPIDPAIGPRTVQEFIPKDGIPLSRTAEGNIDVD